VTFLSGDITRLLQQWSNGDAQALDQLMPLVHDELRRKAAYQMRNEQSGHLLQATALVHEAYLELRSFQAIPWKDRHHFLGVVVNLMRRVLVNYARERTAVKRGSGEHPVALDDIERRSSGLSLDDLVAIDMALDALTRVDERQGRIFEAKFFGGLTNEETAELLEISTATVEREYRSAKAFLRQDLGGRQK
jgi:RNA polymerase sigma factor (TIGR02999 family)